MADGSQRGAAELDRIQPEDLVTLAEALRDLGVTEFSWGAAHVKFQDKLAMVKVQPQTVEQKQEASPPKAKPSNFYEDERLWHGAKPPLFPGQTPPDDGA